jgi:SAM-dependent methyltransferase
MSQAANAEQIAYWNSRAGERWAQWQQAIDRAMAELTDVLLAFAAAQPGENVLDVGCGSGSTSLLLSQAVGARGVVEGIDVSAPMLELARQRAAQAGAPLRLQLADAATQVFSADKDLLFSRFGVMFFADPVAAFVNLRKAARPGARLVFLCWRAAALNEWVAVPMAAARPYLPPAAPTDPLAPGPFALADEARIRRVLGDAGYARVEVQPLDAFFWMGDSAEEAPMQALTIGPLAFAAAELNEAMRAQIRTVVRDALAARLTPRGLPAACWLVRAVLG